MQTSRTTKSGKHAPLRNVVRHILLYKRENGGERKEMGRDDLKH
jgi:hypothetical protein